MEQAQEAVIEAQVVTFWDEAIEGFARLVVKETVKRVRRMV